MRAAQNGNRSPAAKAKFGWCAPVKKSREAVAQMCYPLLNFSPDVNRPLAPHRLAPWLHLLLPWLVVVLVVTGEGAGFADRVALAVPNGWGVFARSQEWTGIVALFFICSCCCALQILRRRGSRGIDLAGNTFTLGTTIAALQLFLVAAIAG